MTAPHSRRSFLGLAAAALGAPGAARAVNAPVAVAAPVARITRSAVIDSARYALLYPNDGAGRLKVVRYSPHERGLCVEANTLSFIHPDVLANFTRFDYNP